MAQFTPQAHSIFTLVLAGVLALGLSRTGMADPWMAFMADTGLFDTGSPVTDDTGVSGDPTLAVRPMMTLERQVAVTIPANRGTVTIRVSRVAVATRESQVAAMTRASQRRTTQAVRARMTRDHGRHRRP